ncbi:hypothetical protein QBC37DRAFT_150415 [Rhypophila decipiens]|uniref:Uncharacterized protein n=1 Tax=Rhypophila decipiens TaxID=261697 RepID=A0AAN6Y968_9PEZI|nr:hypothetical protein QBC37DRAFT_150415 [Rhypophila decipiens]
MDVAYNQHAARRKSRSSTNLNHLTLAPLTSKFPLETDDVDDTVDATIPRSTSYLQGKSAPTTPRLLSRSPGGTSRSTSRSGARLPKSKSATHLVAAPIAQGRHRSNGHSHGPHSAVGCRSLSFHAPPNVRRKGHNHDDRKDSDWLLRTGALISTETRESKGQAWLVSRASSTSLAGLHDPEAEPFERELASGSRRGSVHEGDIYHHHTASLYSHHSPTHSRHPSRSQSRVGSRANIMTPSDRRSMDVGGYFPTASPAAIDDDDDESLYEGPDFVNLDEKLEAAGLDGGDDFEDRIDDDEATVRRLVKRGNGGVGAWFGNLVGVQLFAVAEDEEEDEDEDDDDDDTEDDGELSSASSVVSRGPRRAHFADSTTSSLVDLSERMPPPKPDEGGWQDAAWLLSVASKVLL